MGITNDTTKSILKDYETLRLSNEKNRAGRIEEVYSAIPEYHSIEEQITSLYIKMAMNRLENKDHSCENDLKAKAAELSLKKNSLLKANGFPENYLELTYHCPLCLDTGYLEDGSKCSCFKKKLIEKLYDISHLKDILVKENFHTFSLDYYDDTKAVTSSGQTCRSIAMDAVRKAKTFIDCFDEQPSNIFLTGGTGVGKTFLSNCIAKELIESGHSVIYLSAVRFFDILADSTFEKHPEGDLPSKLIYDCDLLIIDDLGTEMINSFVQTQLFNCINERLLKNKHTIISANLSVEDLQNKYSERVFSRVASGYTLIKLYARDIRIQKALEV